VYFAAPIATHRVPFHVSAVFRLQPQEDGVDLVVTFSRNGDNRFNVSAVIEFEGDDEPIAELSERVLELSDERADHTILEHIAKTCRFFEDNAQLIIESLPVAQGHQRVDR
jgi:hypothetical protein